MDKSSRAQQITVVAVVVALAVGGLLMAMLIPYVLARREAERRTRCEDNMRQIGLGLLNHESALGRFPSSCKVVNNPDGTIRDMQSRGWSWCVYVLPYIDSSCYDGLQVNVPNIGPLDKKPGPRYALSMYAPEFHCPSFKGPPYVDPTTKREAITNYKAMGATHLRSLLVASPTPSTPKYPARGHPDGALYPGSRHGIDGFKGDGSSHTIMVCESAEQNVARWTVGVETCVVGLPDSVTYVNRTPNGRVLKYYAPTGYTPNMFWDQTTIPPSNNLTYLSWDYEKTPYVDNLSGTPLVPRSSRASGPMKYGPSSHHDGIVHHLYGDGSVHPVSEEVDAAAYMLWITRNGHDPQTFSP